MSSHQKTVHVGVRRSLVSTLFAALLLLNISVSTAAARPVFSGLNRRSSSMIQRVSKNDPVSMVVDHEEVVATLERGGAATTPSSRKIHVPPATFILTHGTMAYIMGSLIEELRPDWWLFNRLSNFVFFAIPSFLSNHWLIPFLIKYETMSVLYWTLITPIFMWLAYQETSMKLRARLWIGAFLAVYVSFGALDIGQLKKTIEDRAIANEDPAWSFQHLVFEILSCLMYYALYVVSWDKTHV